jgi:hypothetical protein
MVGPGVERLQTDGDAAKVAKPVEALVVAESGVHSQDLDGCRPNVERDQESQVGQQVVCARAG